MERPSQPPPSAVADREAIRRHTPRGTVVFREVLALLPFRSGWARAGRLRNRVQPNGRIQVLVDDVLSLREAAEGVSAFGGDDLTEEELEELHRSRPGTLPWEREPAAQAG